MREYSVGFLGLNPLKTNTDRQVREAAAKDVRLVPYRPGTHQ